MALLMRTCFALLLTAVLAAGCNLLDPVYSEGGSVDTLIEDARHARASGDLNRAVRLLEQAIEIDASHGIVRYELAITLMQRDQVGISMLEEIMTFLMDPEDNAPAGSAQPAPGSTCTFANATTVEPFEPLAMAGASGALSMRPTSLRAIDLLSQPARRDVSPALSLAFAELNVCEVMRDGGLDYERGRVLAAVRAGFENDHQVTGALVADAIARALTAYTTLFDPESASASWFLVDGGQIGACVDPSSLLAFQTTARESLHHLGRAILSLDLLLTHTGSGRHLSWVNDAVAVFESLESSDTDPCIAD